MKINQLIAKGLSIGFLLNSLSTLSYASTEIPNRYQTLEGEYITIDDSMEGNLEEIEIFGNTIQDENNLEDIQSVGDLYVDEDGNPILDSQGREQYKIDIVSNNVNLFNIENTEVSNTFGQVVNRLNGQEEGYRVEFSGIRDGASRLSFKFINNQTYTLSVDIRREVDNPHPYARVLNIVAEDGVTYAGIKYITLPEESSEWKRYTITFNIPNDNKDYFIWLNGNNHFTGVTGFVEYKNLQVEVGNYASKYSSQKQDKITILLPEQLRKVGNIADKLYWDDNKGRYVIEKNINEVVLNGGEEWLESPDEGVNTVPVHLKISDMKISPGHSINFIMNDKFPMVYNQRLDVEGCYVKGVTGWRDGYLSIRVNASRLSDISLNGVKDWVSKNNIKVYYPLSSLYIIDTNLSSKLKMPTYDGKTHIYVDSQNDINPTLKVTVDRLPQIAKNSVEEAESNSSLNNIALARMYTNMLPESLYKDQLQDQLSNIFSSDMVLDRKTTTSNLDLYIKCENILQMSLSTNSITFDDFSGVEDMIKENAVQISINSSLPYSLNTYLPTEIQNSNKSNTINKDILNIKDNSESTYQTFTNTTDKIILKDNCSGGNDLIHNIDIKLKGGIAHQKDVYKTTIKFEAEQK